MKDLSDFRATFDPILEGLVQRYVDEFAKTVGDSTILSFIQHGGSLMRAGGKRIRPYLASLGYRCVQDHLPEAALRAMASLEFFHLFALIQDDVMDHGTSRHGFPTAHVSVAEMLRQAKRTGDVDHIGQSQAVLLSDLFFNWSFGILDAEREEIGSENIEEARRRFSIMVDEVILGQMIDVDLTTRDVASLELIERKMRLKTASYTFTRPLQIGAALAGARGAALDAFTPFADALGLAFQMQDDLFDLTIRSAQLGKNAFSDLRERQHTVFTQWISEHGTTDERRELATLIGSDVSEADRLQVERLFVSSGAIAAGRAQIEKKFTEAERALEGLSVRGAAQQHLTALIASMKERTI